MAFKFSECLEGTALNYFNRLGVELQPPWATVKERFNKRFGPSSKEYEARLALNKLTPAEGESAEAYKHRFIRVLDELYPGQPTRTDLRDPRMVDRFLETIKDQELCFHLGTKDPASVDDCCAEMAKYLGPN